MLAIAKQGMMMRFAYRGLRLKVEKRSPAMPNPGKRRTYTSGWPKNQNMWSHSNGPPCADVKKTVPNARSATRRLNAETKAGNAHNMSKLVKIQVHVNRGNRMSDI